LCAVADDEGAVGDAMLHVRIEKRARAAFKFELGFVYR
jgi:hypothetical protein